MSEIIDQVTVEMIVGKIEDKHHVGLRDCPQCDEAVGPTALIDCLYVFESCSCEAANYDHLIPVTYHTTCFLAKRANSTTC